MIFCDLNESLCQKVKSQTNLNVECGDIFGIAEKHNALIATASNPEFHMGAGLDLAIRLKYPEQTNNLYYGKVDKNIIGIVSVGYDFKATQTLIRMALSTIQKIDRQQEKEVVFTGIGTKIGGMSEDQFIKILTEILL